MLIFYCLITVGVVCWSIGIYRLFMIDCTADKKAYFTFFIVVHSRSNQLTFCSGQAPLSGSVYVNQHQTETDKPLEHPSYPSSDWAPLFFQIEVSPLYYWHQRAPGGQRTSFTVTPACMDFHSAEGNGVTV